MRLVLCKRTSLCKIDTLRLEAGVIQVRYHTGVMLSEHCRTIPSGAQRSCHSAMNALGLSAACDSETPRTADESRLAHLG